MRQVFQDNGETYIAWYVWESDKVRNFCIPKLFPTEKERGISNGKEPSQTQTLCFLEHRSMWTLLLVMHLWWLYTKL